MIAEAAYYRWLARGQRDGNPEAVFGAWFTNDYTQMDDQQHTIAALLAARDVLLAEGEPT